MIYIIDLYHVPDDLIKAVDYCISPDRPKTSRYLHINSDNLTFFRANLILVEDYEYIDIKKLKEVLLIKHLGE